MGIRAENYNTKEKRDAAKDVFIAFADTASLEELAALPPLPETMPPIAMPEVKVEEEVKPKMEGKPNLDEIKVKLVAIVDNKDMDKAIKKSAEELIAQLEELKAFEENATKFLKDNVPVVVEAELPKV